MLLAQRLRAGKRCAADPECDPHWDDVVLLLHGDGADGSTNFVDSSQSAHTITPAGNAQISTTKSKFGGASLHFDRSSGSYLTVPHSEDFWIATGGTVELWAYLQSRSTGIGGDQPLVGHGEFVTTNSTQHSWVFLENEGHLKAGDYIPSASWAVDSVAGRVTLNTWTHLAFVRENGDSSIFVDGVKVVTRSQTIRSETAPLSLGRIKTGPNSGTFSYFDGYMDEIRITKGVARYTSDFTPPTAAFPNTGP